MPKQQLADIVNPFRLAENRAEMQGVFLAKNMPRFAESLASPDGEIAVDIAFGRDEQGDTFMKGTCKANVQLHCQRCMEPYICEIISRFKFGLVVSEEKADNLAKSYDPLVVIDDELFLKDVIEDELIIHLPIVPMHSEDKCKVRLPIETSEQESNNNPFKVIEILKSKSIK
ncbi:hypothetical protein AYO45_00015 [Gammaproteobacteria bacterium SCGC AG-212-F23]|nr:hypothetical protein AYO45_00015 [Gammaproteobacteria bacterium SCGC AG-212-F23]